MKRKKRYKHDKKTLKLAESYIGKRIKILDSFRFKSARARLKNEKYWTIHRFFYATKNIIFIDKNWNYRCSLEEAKQNIFLDKN